MTDYYPRPTSILIVDDNEDDFESICRAFKKVGLNNPVFLCKTGKEGLDFLRGEGGFKETGAAERPALILLDLNMPGMDGRRVLQIIKEDAALHYIPVIILTTSSNDKDIEACYRMGANAYMQKPVTFEGLLVSIQRLKDYWFDAARLPSGNEDI